MIPLTPNHSFQQPRKSMLRIPFISSEQTSPIIKPKPTPIKSKKTLGLLRSKTPLNKSLPYIANSPLVGSEAKVSFLESFKHLNKINEFNKHKHNVSGPVALYLNKLEEKHLTPIPMGLVRRKGPTNQLDISNFSMGDDYAEALSEGITNINLTKINLKNNRLSDEGGTKLVMKLNPQNILELDMSQNFVNINCIATICRLFQYESSQLQVLKLDENSLCDKPIVLLCSVLSNADRLRELSLAKNKIGELGAKAISQYLRYSHSLQRLDLYWNNIKGEGAIDLATSLSENDSLMAVDLSWNALSSPQQANCAEALSEAFRLNIKLVHLDLSHNSFSRHDCEILSEGLSHNHTILGLHLDGNSASVDPKGFLKFSNESSRPRTVHTYSRMLHQTRGVKRAATNCWVCQRWNEIYFYWKVEQEDAGNLKVHLDFDEYSGDNLFKAGDKNYKTLRMCPPGQIKYFFSRNGVPMIDKDAPTIRLREPIKLRSGQSIDEVNHITNSRSSIYIWTEYFPRTIPRPDPNEEFASSWSLAQSVLKNYAQDSTQLLNDALYVDLSKAKLPQFAQENHEQIAKLLKPIYTQLKETHKHICGVAWDSWKVWQEEIINFFRNTGALDGPSLTIPDITSTLRSIKYAQLSGFTGLYRYQFLELFIKIAVKKYGSHDNADSLEALSIMINRHYSRYQWPKNSQDFRLSKLFDEKVDRVLHRHLSILLDIFHYYSSVEINSEITLEKFKKIFETYTSNFDVIKYSFVMAKETHILDDLYADRLRFVEFIEAFVRVIDQIRLHSKSKDEPLHVALDKEIQQHFGNFGDII